VHQVDQTKAKIPEDSCLSLLCSWTGNTNNLLVTNIYITVCPSIHPVQRSAAEPIQSQSYDVL